MYQKRQQATTKLPIRRKGTKYIARASSHLKNSVPVVIAIRDMLKLARTAREVKEMIKQKLLKINGKPTKDYRESIKIFNIFQADKPYQLTLLPTGKFTFEQTKNDKERLCKILDKKLVKKGFTQLNLHDGSNILTTKKVNVGDSLYLDFTGKITKHIPLDSGKEAIVISGKYSGLKGKIESVKERKVKIKFKDKDVTTELNGSQIIVP